MTAINSLCGRSARRVELFSRCRQAGLASIDAADCVIRARGAWARQAGAVVRAARQLAGCDDVRVAETATDGPWNVNIHYDARLADCVPAAAAAVLDVGCGDG